MKSFNGQVLMTRAPSTEEPCVAKVTSTVLKASGRSDPFAEPDVIKRRCYGIFNVGHLFQRIFLDLGNHHDPLKEAIFS